MGRREEQSQSVNPCQRLYNFMMKFLTRNAQKMPKEACSSRSSHLVHPMAASGTLPNEDDDQKAKTSSPHQEKDKTVSEEKKREQVEDEDEEEEEEEEEEAAAASQRKAPKKMVSINDNVETITSSSSSSKKKKSKSKKKKEQEIIDDIDSKPLKSILKVSSDLNSNISETPPSLLSRANGA